MHGLAILHDIYTNSITTYREEGESKRVSHVTHPVCLLSLGTYS